MNPHRVPGTSSGLQYCTSSFFFYINKIWLFPVHWLTTDCSSLFLSFKYRRTPNFSQILFFIKMSALTRRVVQFLHMKMSLLSMVYQLECISGLFWMVTCLLKRRNYLYYSKLQTTSLEIMYAMEVIIFT